MGASTDQVKRNINGYQGTNSYSTAASTSNPRNSFDQASIHSTLSSQTRQSSIFSSDNTSRTAMPAHMQTERQQDSVLRPGSSHSSNARQSNVSQWSSQQKPGYNSATSFNPEGFSTQKPTSDVEIEEEFEKLMNKRGWQNLPDQAKRQMMAYPPAKKWTLVHQDRLTEWQGAQKRKTNAARQILGYGETLPGRYNEQTKKAVQSGMLSESWTTVSHKSSCKA